MGGLQVSDRLSWADQDLEGNDRYTKIKDLGGGAFGSVILATDHQTGEKVALKFLERGSQINKYVEREVCNHMKLRHPHVIGLREVFLTSSHLVLALEYAMGGDLYGYVARRGCLSEGEARWFFQQIMVALDYCHRMGVTSRDIKLENMLLDGSERPLIKLADFGFSKDDIQHSAPTSRVGTPAYLAPEVIANKNGQVYDAKMADLWSCGVMLFVMVTGDFPFRRPADITLKPSHKLNIMLQRVLRADYSFPESVPLSTELTDLINRILVVDPKQRASLSEIVSHPWFVQSLHPSALSFNEHMLQESLANQPTKDMLEEVCSILRQAQHAGVAKVLPMLGGEDDPVEIPEDLSANEAVMDALNDSLFLGARLPSTVKIRG